MFLAFVIVNIFLSIVSILNLVISYRNNVLAKLVARGMRRVKITYVTGTLMKGYMTVSQIRQVGANNSLAIVVLDKGSNQIHIPISKIQSIEVMEE